MNTLETVLGKVFEAEQKSFASQAPPVPLERLRKGLQGVRASVERKRMWQKWLQALAAETWRNLLAPAKPDDHLLAELRGGLYAKTPGILPPPRDEKRLLRGLLWSEQNEPPREVTLLLGHDPFEEEGGLFVTVFLPHTTGLPATSFSVGLVTTEDEVFQSEAPEPIWPRTKTRLTFEWSGAQEAIVKWRDMGRKIEDLPFRLVLRPAE